MSAGATYKTEETEMSPHTNDKTQGKLPAFDPDLSPSHPHNKKAAEQREWRFDQAKDHYVDSDGCLTADRFGQPL